MITRIIGISIGAVAGACFGLGTGIVGLLGGVAGWWVFGMCGGIIGFCSSPDIKRGGARGWDWVVRKSFNSKY